MFYSNIILSALNKAFNRFVIIFQTLTISFWHVVWLSIWLPVGQIWSFILIMRPWSGFDSISDPDELISSCIVISLSSLLSLKSRDPIRRKYLTLIQNTNLRDFFSSLAFFVFARIFLTVFTILAPEIENITYVHQKNNLPMVKNVITIPIHPKIPK